MARTVSNQCDLRIFICGYSDADHFDPRGEISMWVAMKTGDLFSAPGHEYVTGIKSNNNLRPTFTKSVMASNHLNFSELVFELFEGQPGPLKEEVRTAFTPKRSVEERCHCSQEYCHKNMQNHVCYGAVLVPIFHVRKMLLRAEEGMILFLEKSDLNLLRLHQNALRKPACVRPKSDEAPEYVLKTILKASVAQADLDFVIDALSRFQDFFIRNRSSFQKREIGRNSLYRTTERD